MMRLGNSSLIASLNRQTVDGKCGTKEPPKGMKRHENEFCSFHRMKIGTQTKHSFGRKNSNETFLMIFKHYVQCSLVFNVCF